MKTHTLSADALAHFTGSEEWYRHGLTGMLYTSGVQYVAEAGGAYWLIDAIASYQGDKRITRNARLQEFQLWQLYVREDRSACLTCREDTSAANIIMQEIEFTDFPLPLVKLYVEGKTILLPSEH
jgi:hypothetical protein